MDLKPCSMVNNLTSMLEQCNFVDKNDCLEKDSVIDYVRLIYCDIGIDYELEGILLLVVILILLFIGLGAAANEFLCPTLLALAKILGMSDSVAGVTLLAFGNGCPDIFSSLAAASDNRPELIIGELLGAGIFCTSIVSGLIFISNDFLLACRPMLRDTIFYLVSAYLVWLCCWYGKIRFLYALSFIVIYLVYLLVALSGQAIHRRRKNKSRGFGWHPNSSKSKSQIENNNNNNNSIRPQFTDGQPIGNDTSIRDDFKIRLERQQQYSGTNGEREMAEQSRAINKSTQNRQLFTITKSLRNTIISPMKLHSLSDEYDEPNGANVALKCYSISQERRQSLLGPLHRHFENSLVAITRNSGDESTNNDMGPVGSEFCTRHTRWSCGSEVEIDTDNRVSIAIKWNQANNHLRGYDNYGATLTGDEVSNARTRPAGSERSVVTVRAPSAIVVNEPNQQQNACMAPEEKIESHRHSCHRDELDSLTHLNEWDDFLFHFCPIDINGWKEAKLIDRLVDVARAPIYFFMLMTIPVLDFESRRNNWCRLLNALHCITVPIAITMLTQTAYKETFLFGLPLYCLVLLPGILLAIVVLSTSEYLRPPKYHQIFAYVGFTMSIVWIYSLASEVISLLKTVGIIFSLSDAAIGLGILAWGNSLGDIVANLTLAKSGYPRMAIGACIGAPLLNLLLGFGLSFSVSLGPGGSSSVQYTTMTTLLYVTITLILLSLMLSTLAPPKWSKRYFGYALILIYMVYFILAICIEYGLMDM